jgi:two-component system, cell cycle sensor histidine kinase and response regulator CckA
MTHASAAISRYERLFALSLDLQCVSDTSGRFLQVNPAFERVLGYTAQELLAEPYIEFVHGDDRAATMRALEGLAAGRPVLTFVNRYRHRDGSYRWLSWNASPGDDGLVYGVARDITDECNGQLALAASEERFRLVARASRDAIYDWDIASGTLLFDGSFAATLGYGSERQVTDIAWWTGCIHSDDRVRVDTSLVSAIETGADDWFEEYRFRRGDGTYGEILDRGLLLRDEQGVAVRMIGTMADITDRRELELQLRQAQKMEAVGRLAGGIAHDFNNLLTAITGFTTLLLDDAGPDDHRRADLREILRAADRAASLTRDLLAFSRKQILRPQPFDLNAVVSGMDKMLRRLIGEGIRIETDLDAETGMVLADPGQVEQIIMNLALNARDAMPEGGRLAIATHTRRLLRADTRLSIAAGEYCVLRISDTGAGMDAETRARMFEPFFTTKQAGEGTGLGLATVYGIVKQSGGHILVETAVGQGTTFTVLLPRSVGEAAAEPPEPTRRVSAPRGATVLVVDDEDAVRMTVRRLLERIGYVVLCATGPEDALRSAKAFEGDIHVVISDVVMPGMSGPELVRRLAEARPEMGVVFMSGYTEEGIRLHGALDRGMAFLQKPFSQEELSACVRQALENGVSLGVGATMA